MSTISQALFLRVRRFEQRHNALPAYIMINYDYLSMLKNECVRVMAVEQGQSAEMKFMGVELVPTDKVEDVYLVVECDD